MEATRLLPAAPTPARGLGWEERVTLFAHCLAPGATPVLLDGLAVRSKERARAYLEGLGALPSSQRQGRLAAEFGLRHDATDELRALWEEAGPTLRQVLFALLPPYHRTLFPGFVPDGSVEPSPLMKGFAERLIREACN